MSKQKIPGFLVQCEFAFLVNLIRMATNKPRRQNNAYCDGPKQKRNINRFFNYRKEEIAHQSILCSKRQGVQYR